MQAEPSIDDLYRQYQATPSQESLSAVVGALHPTINYALSAVGASNDPLVKSKALVFTADAIKKFDPKQGTSLPTFISSNLRQLSRTARQSRAIIKVPERVQLESYKLSQLSKQFEEKHGREPDTLELADFSGLPVRRIEKIRRYNYSTPSESSSAEPIGQENADFQKEALEYIYNDADHLDRRILELKTGYGGVAMMEPKGIAVKLGLTPSQLSRRSAKLVHRINEIQSALEQV